MRRIALLAAGAVAVMAACLDGCGGSSSSPDASRSHDADAVPTDGGGRGGGAGGAGGGGRAGTAAGGGGGNAGGGRTGGAGGGGAGGQGPGAGGGAAACTKAKAACVADNTGCDVDGYYFYDNHWNCGPQSGFTCGPESGYACANPDGTTSFVVTSNQPAGNTAVLTYPAMQKNFSSNPPLSGFASIVSTFSERSPGAVGDYEVAWDCWFNDYANELMIWVDTYKQVPGGKKVASGVSLGSHAWDAWYESSSGYLAFRSTATITSGTIDLLQIFQYAVTNGWLPATSTVTQLDFGVEVCSTDGKDATWSVDGYTLTAR